MVGFKSFEAAQGALAGIELMHMMKKQLVVEAGDEGLTTAEPFDTLTSPPPLTISNLAELASALGAAP